MAIIKLKVGEKQTLRIVGSEEVEGDNGAQWRFDAENGDAIYLSEKTAQRQLGRLGLTPENAAGHLLEFSKVDGGEGRTFINVNKPKASGAKAANGAQAQRGNGGIPAGAGSASVRPPRPLVPLYEDCFSAAKGIVQKQLGAKATTADVVAACATLFIQATKNQSPLFATAQDDWDTPVEELTDDLPF